MARPPVCKLMDYGKFKYESALKARESRKNQAQTVIKEIKLRPKIDPHDYGTKKGHVERFLKQGDKVKVTIMFRGREQSRPELGFKLLQRLASDVEELGFVESTPKQDGRNMIMVIGPHKRKTDAMAAAKAERATERASRSGRPALAETADLPDLEAEAMSQAADSAPDADSAPARPAAASPAPASPAPARTAPASSPAPASPAAPASPRPAAPRPQARPGAASPAAPKPSAPRSAASPAPRPGAPSSGTGTPRPSAPRSTAAAARTTSGSSATTAKPGPARRATDGPVPSPRTVAADKTRQSPSGRPAEGGESES
jgi:translation initiation factor IF-3